jgi:exodeoxyribonuclease VIII
MIDLETMGTSTNAAIIAIGAVAFDIETGELGEKFYDVIDLDTSVKCGGVMDTSTVLWWMAQTKEAQREFERVGEHEFDVLLDFNNYMSKFDDVKVWGNGASFDNVILANAYRRHKVLDVPWEYYNDRCYRTMKSLAPHIKMEREGTHHNALSDAISQAKHLIRILAK